MKYDPTTPPTPDIIKQARLSAGLTQEQAAELVHRTERKRWNEWETGVRHMKQDTWELFLIHTKQHPKGGLK